MWLEDKGSTRFAPDGVRAVAQDATARVEVEVLDDADEAVDLTVRHRRGDAVVEGGARAAAGTPTSALEVADPAPWTADTPHLYDLVVEASRDGTVLTEHTARVGIRTVSAHPCRGLLANGATTLLHGGCLHHDNGVLGRPPSATPSSDGSASSGRSVSTPSGLATPRWDPTCSTPATRSACSPSTS